MSRIPKWKYQKFFSGNQKVVNRGLSVLQEQLALTLTNLGFSRPKHVPGQVPDHGYEGSGQDQETEVEQTGLFTLIQYNGQSNIQLGSEIRTFLDFEWSESLVCKWSRFLMGSEIWKSNHLKSRQMASIFQKPLKSRLKCMDLKWSCFHMVETLWKRNHLKSNLQKVRNSNLSGFQITTVYPIKCVYCYI